MSNPIATSQYIFKEEGLTDHEPHLDAHVETLEALEAEAQAREAAQAQYQFGLSATQPFVGALGSRELLAWLAQHNDKLNHSLRQLMTGADDRLKLAEDYTNVKSLLGAKLDQGEAKAAAEAMIAQYKGTPFEDEVRSTLEPLVESLDNRLTNWAGTDLPDDLMSKHTSRIQQQIDSLQKQDQLDMIAIQDLVSQIRENTQLVSNIISSINQTSMSIIGNVGRA
jgi:hypothetical protein